MDITRCFEHLTDAHFEHRQLLGTYSVWVAGRGVEVVSEPEAVSPRAWYVRVREHPRPDLCVMGANVFASLHAALTSLAVEIYRAAGGDFEDRRALSVRFPVVDDPEKWVTVLRRTIPTPWPAAEAVLRSVQPFAKQSASRPVSVLRSLAESAPLQLFVGRNSSELDDVITSRPDIDAAACGRVIRFGSHQPGSRVASRESSSGSRELVFRLPGEDPSDAHRPPKVEFGFQAADGTKIRLMDIKSLIIEVGSIVTRFADLGTT